MDRDFRRFFDRLGDHGFRNRSQFDLRRCGLTEDGLIYFVYFVRLRELDILWKIDDVLFGFCNCIG